MCVSCCILLLVYKHDRYLQRDPLNGTFVNLPRALNVLQHQFLRKGNSYKKILYYTFYLIFEYRIATLLVSYTTSTITIQFM